MYSLGRHLLFLRVPSRSHGRDLHHQIKPQRKKIPTMSHPTYTMTPLPDHKYFEALIARGKDERIKVMPKYVVVYFTAEWCGYCRDLDLKKITDTFPMVTFFKCDIDQNKYTPGYCQVSKIPTFIAIQETEFLDKLTSADTGKVMAWINSIFIK